MILRSSLPANKFFLTLLYDTAVVLQQGEAPDDQEEDSILSRLGEIRYLFKELHAAEKMFAWQVLSKTDGSEMEILEKEYEAGVEMIQRLEDTFSSRPESYTAFKKKIQKEYDKCVLYLLEYIERKEDLLYKKIPQIYFDKVIVDILLKMLKTFSAKDMPAICKWIVLWSTDQEILFYIKIAMLNPSNFFCVSILEEARRLLEKERWERLQSTLTEGALLA